MSERQSRILAAGDSFIGIFSLFKKEANIDINKLKGATAKGLSKPLNENRLMLIELASRQPKKYDCCIFSFGQVDVNHSFYYNVIGRKQELDIFEYYENIADNYVDFIMSLDIPLTIVCAVYPSPLATSEVPRELMTYNILGAEDVVNFPLSEWWRLASREARHHRLEVFNKALERACRRHRNQNRSVIFISLNDAILDENNGVKPLFKDINPVNLHLLWEPLIVLWAEKLSSLNIGISPHMLVDMKRSASAYVSRKAQEVGDQVFAIGPRLRVIMDYLQEHSDIAKETTEADKRIIEKESRVTAPVVKEYTTHVDKDKAAFGDWRRQGGNTVTTSNNRSRRGSDNSTEKSTSENNSSLSYQLKDTSSHRMTSRTSSIDYSNGGSLLPTHSNNSNTINYGKVNSPSSSSGGGRTYEIATTSNADTDNMRASLSRRNSRDGAPEPSPRSHTGGSPRKEQLQLQSPRTDRRRGSDPESEGQTAQNQHTAPWTGRERGQRDVQGQGQGIDGGQGRKEKETLRLSEDQPQSKGRQERQKLRPQTLSDRFKSYADTQGEEHSGGSAPRLIQPFEEMMRHKDGEGGGGLMQRGGGRDDGRHRGNRDGERDRDRERHVRR